MQMVDSFDFDTHEDREKLVMPNENFPRSCAYNVVKLNIKKVQQQKARNGHGTPSVGLCLYIWNGCLFFSNYI